MRAGKRSCTRFLLVDGGGVIKRLSALCSERRKSEVEEGGGGGGGEASANESNFADFQSGVSLSLSLRREGGEETFSLQINPAGSPLLSLPFSD